MTVDGFTAYQNCTGYVTVLSAAGDRARLREHITEGDCFDHGLIETRKVGNKLLFRWYRQDADGPDEQNDVIALGTLTGSGPALGPPPG